jgi:hypothetical protein
MVKTVLAVPARRAALVDPLIALRGDAGRQLGGFLFDIQIE